MTIDVSGSMAADDVTPTRIDAAKVAAHELVDKLPNGTRIGVVSFSDDASIVQAPTVDREAVIAAVDRLGPGGSTVIGRGLLSSLQAILENSKEPADPAAEAAADTPALVSASHGQYYSALVVLLTDGENNEQPEPLAVLDKLTTRGIRVFTIGLGTSRGVIETPGGVIGTQLDEQTLKAVANSTGGQYFNASNATDLRTIYRNLSTKVVTRSEPMEVTAPISGIASLLSLAALVLSLAWLAPIP
jgi:Ca-activated chloride channel homolog